MRKQITTVIFLVLADISVAIVHAEDSRNRSAPPATNSGQQVQQVLPLPAPVGHRQPRADQVPAEEKLTDPNDPINQQNAALDRIINGICRGC
jgi:hypothetical protein